MINKKNIKKNNIIFGIVLFFLFLIIGFYPLKSGNSIRIWSVLLSLVFLIITLVRPNLLAIFNKFWIQFGNLLGKIISPIIMALVFFFVVTPTGILIRVLKKDVMGLKSHTNSYWIDRKDKEQNFRKQF